METIVCATCGTDNRAGRRFCRSCGAELGAVCPACGAANEAGDRFCGTCGSALATAAAGRAAARPPAAGPVATPGAPAGPTLERRLVTVLFADLVGSTAMAEGQDVEAVRDLLGRYYELCREIVDRYGGTIEKFIGDAVMAVWGAPVAREDDAERAVRAALDLVDAARAMEAPSGAPLRVRAGVLTGEAAVTLGADGEAMVAGDLVNTASRLQSMAPPAAVLAGEATVRASEAAIDYEPAGEQPLKGKSAPVSAWRALRVAARRLGSGRVNRLEPPFVGRDDELRLLKEVFHQTARERRPRLVSITGIAGIGKSRLAWELEKYMDGLVETVYWHQGRSPAYGDGIAFWALGEMVRRRARIAETDDPATARQKLGEMAGEYLPDPEERRRVEPRLAALLGLEPAPPGGAEELTGAWRTLFERIADLGPTVLVFEDLHWADSALLDFIESLLAGARSKPILVVALARPELMISRPTWGAAVRNHLRLDLAPLDDAAMELLLVGLAPGIPPEAIAAIRTRAEGIPLYAVETVRMLVDQGRVTETEGRFRLVGDLAGLAVPESLQALLGSRLDALDATARDLVGHCAVLGVSFTVGSVAALAGRDEAAVRADLDALVERELLALDDDPRSPERGQYHFLQGVLREVAYGRLARRERQARHLAAARAFEAAGADELAGVVATHYLEAVRAAPEGDAGLRGRALEALRAAAARSHSVGAYAGAARYLGDALELAADDGERLALREARLAELYDAADLEAVELEGRALVQVGRESGDRGLQSRAGYALAGALVNAGRPSEAVAEVAAIREALGAFAVEDPDGLRLTAELGRCQLMSGDPWAAAVTIEATLPVVERLGLRDVIAELLPSKGWALAAQGRPIEAMALHRGALAFAERDGRFRAEIRARMNLSAVGGWEDPREAFEVTRVGLERARARGYDNWAVSLAGNAASEALALGEWDWIARTVADLGLDERDGPWEQSCGLALATVHAYRGRAADAGRIHERVAAITGPLDDHQLAADREGSAAEIAFARGDLEAAETGYAESARISASVGNPGEPTAGFVALERRDPSALRRLAGGQRAGRLLDLLLDAFAAGADVLEDAGGFGRVDAATRILEEAGVRFLAAQLRRARAMLAPDDPGAGVAARAALSVFRDLDAITMFRGLERWLDEPPVEAAHVPDGSMLGQGNASRG
jgi:class 3 adenylate cyclase